MKNVKKKFNLKAFFRKNMVGWLIMIPSLALFIFFVWLPLCKNIILSFFNDYSFSEFVFLENYKAIFEDEAFLAALKNAFVYILWSIIIGYFAPILMGFLLNECIHAKGLFRVCLYIPCMISGIAVVFLFKNIYGSDSYSILNIIFNCKDDPLAWAGDPNWVIPLIVLAMTWKGAGGTALIYLSNFQQIDVSLYEASRIDGANSFQRLLKVTLPQMKNTLLTLFILQIISVFQVFYEPLVIGSKGGPGNSSMTLMLQAYLYAFQDLEYAKAAATSVFLALIILVFTLIYFALTKYLNKKESGK